MRILMLAFSCIPNAGSEPGVAWNWMKSLAAKSHDITILTRASNREKIAAAVAKSAELQRISFRYIGSVQHDRLAHRTRFFLQVYYVYWQLCARRAALRFSREKPFDIVHAITFGGVRFPAFLGDIARQSVVGPMGGGETAPTRLTDAMGLRIALVERLRHTAKWANRYDPFMRATFKRADVIFVTSNQSAMAVPPRYRSKCVVQLQIGVDEREIAPFPLAREHTDAMPFRILYAGRHVHWKGMEFGLRAFAQLLQFCPNASLSLTGDGPATMRWRALAGELGVADRVTWLGWGKYHELPSIYRSHHALLFPSLHEAAGMAVVDAFAAGLPVICFNLGGPGVLVDDRVGRAVDVSGASYSEAVDRLAAALRYVAELDADSYQELSRNALDRAHGMVWQKVVDKVYARLGESALPRGITP